MSTECIFGTWDSPPEHGGDHLDLLWHRLAAQQVGTPKQVNNFGLSQRRHEITMLWELYQRAKPQVVVEIGVAQGGTFASWCILGQPNATIIGIDRCLDDSRPRPGDPVDRAIYSGPLKMYSHGGGIMHLKQQHQQIIGINGWTSEAGVQELLKKTLGDRKIDFLFHDASHEASMARADFIWLWPLIADGGIFASHDIAPSDDLKCNKREWWLETVDTCEYSARYEFHAGPRDQNMSIGVLIK